MMTSRRGFCLMSLASLIAAPAAKAAPLCVETALGSVCLERPAMKVVSLDQQSTEYLLALGLQPAGVTGPANYRRFTGDEVPRLADTVIDLGLSSAPNIELIMAIEPDLIVGNVSGVQKSLSMLQDIAPVAAFLSQPSGSPDQFANMSATFRAFATLTGRQAEGETFLAGLDAGLEEARARFAEAGLGDRRIILGNVNSGVTGAEIMLFNANALPAQILVQCGFRYEQNDERFADKGFTVTTAESLIAFQDADFLYMPFNAKGVENLMATPIWRNLRSVREGRVHAVPYRLIHNGPLSARLFLRDLQKALLP